MQSALNIIRAKLYPNIGSGNNAIGAIITRADAITGQALTRSGAWRGGAAGFTSGLPPDSFSESITQLIRR
jgi:hypothetical protein